MIKDTIQTGNARLFAEQLIAKNNCDCVFPVMLTGKKKKNLENLYTMRKKSNMKNKN